MEIKSPLPEAALAQLRHVVKHFPIIDNHAHNLILPSHMDTIPFESITSEAQGKALRDVFKSLPHLRAARQLRQLYELSDEANWEDLMRQRIEWLSSNNEHLHQRCFEGVHAILIDDGLAGPEKVHPYSWHDRYTKSPSKRIVRIETVAERLMERILKDAVDTDLEDANYLTDVWLNFTDEFERNIQGAIMDEEVAGFKTVICYRTGLDIEPDYEHAARHVGHPFERYVERCIHKRKYRIEKKPLNDYLVLRTLEILSEDLPHLEALSKPLQLHTGLGDNDISLEESNPAYLQPLIENYSRVPFVILHSAWPYTREASYLAAVYHHVYLDVGEVFPMISRDGQENILRQAIEVAPGSKLLYSSDGHWFAETYWLANQQFREVWLDILLEYIHKGDVTPHQAIAMTKDILFNNSNVLYDLRFHVDFVDMPDTAEKSLTYRPKSGAEFPYQPPPFSPPYPSEANEQSTLPHPEPPSFESPVFPPPPKIPHIYDVHALDDFLGRSPEVNFVYIQWLDYMATLRARIMPIKEFARVVRSGERIVISQGNTGTLQNDELTPVVNTTGQIYVEPDLRSLRVTHRKDPLHAATVLSYWRDESGQPIDECARTRLENFVNDLQYSHGIKMMCGFEIEVTFLSNNQDNIERPYQPLTKTHAWGTLTAQQWLQLPLLAEIATSLSEMGIEVQQFHAESGQGQYEFILEPQSPLRAIDSLIQARQVITQISAMHNIRATLHPQPLPGIGTAAHAHISLDQPDKDRQFFLGGVLKHLSAICAFTMPEAESYSRVVDDHWTGGTWVAWGTQNRETPLRRVQDGRWEIRCVDGFANMYFAFAAIIGAGLLGLKSGVTEFSQMDLPYNPSQLNEEQRSNFGITEKMPGNLTDAINALRNDGDLREILGGLVNNYLIMKDSEQKMLDGMSEKERQIFLIERY